MSIKYDLLNYVHWRGNPGGKEIWGGTAAGDGIRFVATSGAGIGSETIEFSCGSDGDESVAQLTSLVFNIFKPVTIVEDNANLLNLTADLDTAVGAFITLYHDSASPADSDFPGGLTFKANDDLGNIRITNQIFVNFEDVTSTTMDSSISFQTMDNVNAGNVNKTASLSSLGVWTDASGIEGKTFEGVIPNVCDKLKLLQVEKYRSSRVPPEKLADAERHYSPSAEAFFAVFGLGKNPATTTPGIAPKDLAGIAIAAIQEIIPRLEALEAGKV